MIKRFLCNIFFHPELITVRKLDNRGSRKVYCSRCGRYYSFHPPTKSFLEWDTELEDLHSA